ncbi:MAG TPA: hypothetical protein VGO90_16960 [Chthoniobacteraceae bacterium]|nr:hypothetical protein [Chthoniobacteraceae bacterium]
MLPRRRNLPRFILSGSAAAILSFTSSGVAVENLWTGGTNNDWNTATNWSLGRVPASTNGQPAGDTFDDAVINTSTNFPVITADLAASPHDIIVGGASGTIGRVDHRAGTVTTATGTAPTAGGMFIGRNGGTGTYNLANTAGAGGALTGFGIGSGALNLNGLLYVGGGSGTPAGSIGTFNLNTTGAVTIGSDLTIGSAGTTGVMNVDAGTISTGGWNFFGKNEGTTGGNGKLRMSGGTLTNNGPRTFIGLGDSTGSLEMSGGTYNNMVIGLDTFFAVGVNNLDNVTTPSLNMTGGTINSARVFTIGGTEAFGGNGDPAFVGSGKGAATINGASARLNSFGEFWVGQGVGSIGELTLNAGAIAVDNWIDIGRFGATGRVNVTGGTLTKSGSGHFLVGDGGGANGTLTQSGGTIAINSGELWVGQNGAAGQYDMSGGTLSVGNWTAIGRTGGSGILNLSGGTINKTGGGVFILADPTGSSRMTTGVLNQTGPSNLNTNEIWVGQGNGGNGTYAMSAGTMTSTGWVAIGREGGVGTVELSGSGAMVKAGIDTSHIIIGSLGGNGTVNQTGGSFTVNPGGGRILMGEGNSQAVWDLSGGTGSADALIVSWNGGSNEVRVRGTGALTAGFINIGEAGGGGKGIVNQTGGTITSNQWIAVGIGSSQEAEYNLSGGTTNAVGFEVADTQGIVRISGTGVLNVSGNIEMPSRNGSGVVQITGGTVNTNNYLQGGRDGNSLGSGVTNQSGGSVNVTGDLVVQRPGVGLGTYNLSGGTLAVNGAIQGTVGTFTFTGGKITRSNPGAIIFNGNLTTGAAAATLGLNADKTFQINGALK